MPAAGNCLDGIHKFFGGDRARSSEQIDDECDGFCCTSGGRRFSASIHCEVTCAAKLRYFDAMPEVRVAELVALLSLGTDLGLGQPMEHMIRTCALTRRFAERLGLPDSERRVLYYSGLLAWVGCHTDAYEQAKWFGEDIASKSDAHYAYDLGRVGDVASFMLRYLGGSGRPLLERLRVGAAFLGDGRRALRSMAENHYLATDELALQLGLGADVRAGLKQSFERWDGKGALGLVGEDILLTARLVQLADVVEVFRRSAGVDAALTVARARRGTQFDPALVDRLCAEAPALLSDLDSSSSWDWVIASEPALASVVADDELDAALAAIGEFSELKSPWTLGHARGVSELAARAGKLYGLPEADIRVLRRAALVHDIGQLGVSNAIWDKREALSHSELERVRLHPYLGERMLSFSKALQPLGALVAQHHERLDGSGYPNGLSGVAIPPSARILAAADVYDALTNLRPHRDALTADEAAAQLNAEVARKRIDGDAARAVLRAAGHHVAKRQEWPLGLTSREVDVLRLVARGLSNKEVAQKLSIAPKTVSNHVEHLYLKIGVSNRAMASLFAVKHGLMHEGR